MFIDRCGLSKTQLFDNNGVLDDHGWYYEVELLTDGLMQIGWAEEDYMIHTTTNDPTKNSIALPSIAISDTTDISTTNVDESNGVGDDQHSW